MLAPEKAYERRWYTLAVLCLSLLVISVDNSILNVALPSIVRELGAGGSDLQWIVDSYVIVFAVPAAHRRRTRRQVRAQGRALRRPGDLRHVLGRARRSRRRPRC